MAAMWANAFLIKQLSVRYAQRMTPFLVLHHMTTTPTTFILLMQRYSEQIGTQSLLHEYGVRTTIDAGFTTTVIRHGGGGLWLKRSLVWQATWVQRVNIFVVSHFLLE